MYLGKAYYQSAKYNQADTVFTKVTSLYPDNMQAYLWIANTYASLDPESKEGLAKPKYEQLILKASSDSVKYAKELFEAFSYFASYYVITKPDFENGVKYAQKIISLDSKNNVWQKKGFSLLGILYTKKKEYIKAKAAWEKVKELDPKNSDDAQKAIDGINKVLKAQAAAQ
jgi:tetratricopeptide (TPR) repeat protein